MTEQKQLVVEQKKKVDKFKMTLKTTFNKRQSDYIFLELSLSNELLDLLRDVTVQTEETIDASYSTSESVVKFKRYKFNVRLYFK